MRFAGFQFSAESWSFAGWIAAFSAFDHSSGAGVCYIIGACCWSLEATYSFWCLKDAYFFFRGAGGVEQVRNEAALAAFRQSMARV